MKKSEAMKRDILEELYPFLDVDDCGDDEMERFEEAITELIQQVEMETRIKKNDEFINNSDKKDILKEKE